MIINLAMACSIAISSSGPTDTVVSENVIRSLESGWDFRIPHFFKLPNSLVTTDTGGSLMNIRNMEVREAIRALKGDVSYREGLTLSKDSKKQILASYRYLLTRESSNRTIASGAPQWVTWYATDHPSFGKLDFILSSASQRALSRSEVGLLRDALAIAPLNVTPKRFADILNRFNDEYSLLELALLNDEDFAGFDAAEIAAIVISALSGVGRSDKVSIEESYNSLWVGYNESFKRKFVNKPITLSLAIEKLECGRITIL